MSPVRCDDLHEGCERRGGVCDCGERPCALDRALAAAFCARGPND